MGTRNITAVISKGKLVLSQYGQWDGYFSYTGVKFLEFVKENLQRENRRGEDPITEKDVTWACDDFAEKLGYVGDADTEISEIINKVTKQFNIDSKENNTEYAIPFSNLFPSLSRDTGVEILNLISKLSLCEMQRWEGEGDKRKLIKKKLPVHICTDIFGVEFVNVIDLDKQQVYMLTCHEFEGKPQRTSKLIKESFKGLNCWYKSKIIDLPSIKDVEEYKNSIKLDYWQRENGEWVSN